MTSHHGIHLTFSGSISGKQRTMFHEVIYLQANVLKSTKLIRWSLEMDCALGLARTGRILCLAEMDLTNLAMEKLVNPRFYPTREVRSELTPFIISQLLGRMFPTLTQGPFHKQAADHLHLHISPKDKAVHIS